MRPLLLALWLCPALALAHAHLLTPTPRNTLANKTGPCGSPRTATSVNFAPGATITLTWAETINHPGHYRIAFSPANDQGFDANILRDNIPNPAGTQATNTATVTLPTTPCTGCTLQLIQVMTNTNPASNYYSCADITIGTANTAPTVVTAANATPALVTATTTQLAVLGADNAGEAALRYTWAASTAPSPVTFSVNGTNAAKATTATFSGPGAYVFRVTITDAANLTVTSMVNVTVNAALTSVVVAPATAAVAMGGTRQFTASARNQFGATLTVPPAFAWTVAGGGTVSASGLFTGGATAGGPFTLTATGGGRSGTAAVSITAGTPPTVATPAAASTPSVSGATVNLSVLGADDTGAAGLTYTWATTAGPAAVTFSANGTNAARATTATFTRAGTYRFEVTIEDAANLTVTSAVTVTVTQTLTALTVSPPTASVMVGQTQAFSAAGADQFGDAVATPPAVTWVVSASGGTITSSGLFTAAATPGGPHSVRATSAGLNATASVTVTAADAPTITQAASASPAMVTMTTTELDVLGADDGGEAALRYTWRAVVAAASVTFSAANGSNAGKKLTATFTKAGVYQLEVEVKDATGKLATSAVDVTVAQTPTQLLVSAPRASVAPNEALAFTALARDQFAVPLAVTPAITWMVSGGGSISADGVFTASAEPGGPFTVTATADTLVGTAAVSVEANAVRDVTFPSVSLDEPVDGAVLEGLVTLTATASDNVGVVKVVFTVDGAVLAPSPADGHAHHHGPWTAQWDTTTSDVGNHFVVAIASDAAGNTTRSKPVQVRVVARPSGPTGQVGCTAGVGGPALTAVGVLLLRATRRSSRRRSQPSSKPDDRP
ncbi:MAG: Ig-like domain-containing protein [Myxococcales bacterium]|nr:Ig-like domain-containing protein [Myxococcales bacterium]